MDWSARVRSALSGANAADEDVVAELAQDAAAAYETARNEGASREEAIRAVEERLAIWRRHAGLLTRPRPRPEPVQPPRAAARGLVALGEELWYAARRLTREPWHSALVGMTLALGIGATTVLFSVVNGVLLRPLPWPEARRLVRLSETRDGATRHWPWKITNATYIALAEGAGTIDGLAAWRRDTVTWSGDGDAERVPIASVTASLFPLLKARAQLGAVFRAEDEVAGDVLLLSHGLWQRRFGGRADVIGRPVRLDGESYQVIGVMPRDFAFPDREASAWKPFHVSPVVHADGTPAGLSIFSAIARLRPGATPERAAEEATIRACHAPDPGLVTMALFGTRAPARVSVAPAGKALTADVRPALLILLAAIGLLLATATANVASLQLVRATARRRELAIRSALGAGAGRLARLLLLESMILGTAGGAAGLVLAAAAHRSLPALLPADFPRADAIVLDGRVAAFAVALALACGIGAGLLPALFARRLRLTESLGDDTAGAVGAGRSGTARARSAILAGQVAVATLLLLGALQLGRSFVRMLSADRGYEADRLLTLRLPMPEPAYTSLRREQLVTELLARLRGLAGVSEVAFANILPQSSGGDAMAAWTIVSPSGDHVQRAANASVRQVSPGYFRALGRRMLEGRPLDEADTRTSTPAVVVNRAFARRYLDDRALGASIPAHLDRSRPDWTVVGVVDDVVQRSLTDPQQPEVLVCYRQLAPGLAFPEPSVVIRTTSDPEALAPAVRSIIKQVDEGLAPEALVPMRRLITGSLEQPRLYTVILGAIAGCAAIIAGIGLFGALSYAVSLRRREIGVRLALGARPSDVALLVTTQGLQIAVVGVVLGLGASLILGRLIAGLLYGVSPHDVTSLVAVPAALVLLSAAASVVPAIRAARVDPQRALRCE